MAIVAGAFVARNASFLAVGALNIDDRK